MHLHRSNRTEKLLDALVEVVERPLARVLEPECIVVQGPGMERWLSLELSPPWRGFFLAFPFIIAYTPRK